ncbi:MAG: hypothetical protein QNK04_05805 [Myxococcota bacterium]|nr:hypothetical protein [Myxococcota bacterium]
MKTPTRPLAAAGVADLRTPLSRVALAAGQLARTDLGPSQRRLLEAIAEAVEDLDARVGRLLRVLLASEHPADATPADVDAILGELHDRFEGVLSSCGIRWKVECESGVRLRADSQLVRRAAVALLRAATRALREGGLLELRPVRRRDRGGLELRLVPDAAEEPVVCEDAGLASFAADHRLHVKAFRAGESHGTVLWLAPGGRAA